MPPDSKVVSQLGKLFIERRDTRAVQHKDGSYTPERTKFTMANLRDHIEGKRTYGHYLISPENRCRLFAFDLDIVKHATLDGQTIDARAAFLDESHWARPQLIGQLNTLAVVLARRTHKMYGLNVAAAYSGSKGLHVYCFTGSESSELIREAGLAVLESFKDRFQPIRGANFFGVDGYAVEVEVFPKQSNLDGKDLGNLMRLPLGVNQKTGQRSFFLRLHQGADHFTELSAQEALIDGALPW